MEVGSIALCGQWLMRRIIETLVYWGPLVLATVAITVIYRLGMVAIQRKRR